MINNIFVAEGVYYCSVTLDELTTINILLYAVLMYRIRFKFFEIVFVEGHLVVSMVYTQNIK